ncbi:hypothetical protein [Arenibaculum pallidiluteum]|uniref:hypothetical protein n=1 Tax=Arenibaculum pallidiluteum TaxID=2812559 RepID=UPI001A96695E|nr:hypothetical protein [Arenibaculum pallidiluteum]
MLYDLTSRGFPLAVENLCMTPSCKAEILLPIMLSILSAAVFGYGYVTWFRAWDRTKPSQIAGLYMAGGLLQIIGGMVLALATWLFLG